ncbi:MAG: AAA family ATPase [Bdellovibrionota bacterium]
MKILRLELFGFKSFKDKTIIAFDQPITAIVGSNGCGKSNVIDALYWVMGDMSAKHLRGTHMSDVIFSGSRDHAPLDLAEVSLVLERDPATDPELPAQFQASNEIQITRRYYRSGETEYLINRIPCRLRDIQEFFMDTGLGAKAYSIIEQGAISRLVTQKPEERRTVIEEVAGIMKFKARKAETERKLANSRTNLDRIDDILKDLKKSLATLKAQATKAEKFRSYSDELKSLELRLVSREWLSRTGDKTEASQVVERLRFQVSENEAHLETLKLQLEESELNLIHLEEELGTARQSTRNSEVQLKELEGRMGSLNTRKDSLREQVEGLESTLTGLQTRESALETELNEALDQIETLNTQSEETLARLEASLTQLHDMKEGSEQYRAQLGTARRSLHDIEIKQTRLTQEIQGLQKTLAQLANRKGSLETQLESVAQEIASKEDTKRSTLSALEEAFGTRSDLEAAKNEVDADLLRLETSRTELSQIRDKTREELTIVRVRKEQLEALDQNLEGIDASSKTLALHLREKGLQESLLLDSVKVPGTFEKAVEAALGQNLQRVAASSFNDIEDLQHFLANHADSESKNQKSRFWIPGLSIQNSQAGSSSNTLENVFMAVPERDMPAPNVSMSDWSSSDDTGDSSPASFSSSDETPVFASEVPGPDGLVAQEIAAPVFEFQKLPQLQSVREYLLARSDVIGPMRDVLVNEEVASDSPWLCLLEDFWIVRDRKAFTEIALDLETLPMNLVSLDGDILWKEGFLDVAPLESNEATSTSLVHRKREIKELREQTSVLENEFAAAQAMLDDCMQSYNHAKAQFRELTARLSALNPDVENLSHLLRQDEASLARLQEKTSLLGSDLVRAEHEMAEVSSRITQLVTELEGTEDERHQAETSVHELQLQLDTRLEEQRAHETAHSTLQNSQRQMERELGTAETRRATLEHEKSSSAARKLQIEERLVEIEQDIRSCVVEIEKRLEDIAVQQAAFEGAQAIEIGLLESVQTGKASLKEIENGFDTKNRENQRIVSDIRDLQQQLAIHDVELKNLSQKLIEQYNIVIEDLSLDQLSEMSTPLDTEEVANPETARERADQLRRRIENLGKINMVAVEEFDEKSKRYEFLYIQRQDVHDGIKQLEAAIERIDRESRERFSEAFVAVNQAFQKTFPVLFGGGMGELRLTNPDNLLETGVEIVAQPPGKKLQSVTLLSGGEKALTAVSLIFGIFSIKPSPFCVLDEVDAPLDDANVGRFNKQIRNMSNTSQIIMITHHKQTMDHADALFGVTMEHPGVSKVASVKLGELKIK